MEHRDHASARLAVKITAVAEAGGAVFNGAVSSMAARGPGPRPLPGRAVSQRGGGRGAQDGAEQTFAGLEQRRMKKHFCSGKIPKSGKRRKSSAPMNSGKMDLKATTARSEGVSVRCFLSIAASAAAHFPGIGPRPPERTDCRASPKIGCSRAIWPAARRSHASRYDGGRRGVQRRDPDDEVLRRRLPRLRPLTHRHTLATRIALPLPTSAGGEPMVFGIRPLRKRSGWRRIRARGSTLRSCI